MQKLKELKLIEARDLQKIKFPGIMRAEHVYNDYHERSTNAGFSRNFAGKFYTKWDYFEKWYEIISLNNIYTK